MKRKKCLECNGTKRIGVYGNVPCYECKGKGYLKYKCEWEKKFDKKFTGWNAETFPTIKRLLKQKWEKEFEDELYSLCHGEFILNLLEKYSLTEKVKIKCKDGCIQIERLR